MIGDTNLFLHHSEDSTRLAEAEIMIAEKSARRKRRGWEAMLLMLRYGKFSQYYCIMLYPLFHTSYLPTCEYEHGKKPKLAILII
jgi:hypothetical protein